MKDWLIKLADELDFHCILYKVIRYFVSACGITLLLCFFGKNTETLTRENIKAIVTSVFMLEVVFGVFSWYLRTSNTLDTSEGKMWQEVAAEAILAGIKPETVDEHKKIITVHEAGHATMAYLKNLKRYDIDLTNNCVQTLQALESIEEYKDSIMVKYAGAAAEEIIFGQFRSGCFGTKTADFESAAELIKGYIVMTDNTVSKAMLAEEMRPKIIELSNKLYADTVEALKSNQDMITDLAKELEAKDKIDTEEVRIILMKSIIKRNAKRIMEETT